MRGNRCLTSSRCRETQGSTNPTDPWEQFTNDQGGDAPHFVLHDKCGPRFSRACIDQVAVIIHPKKTHVNTFFNREKN